MLSFIIGAAHNFRSKIRKVVLLATSITIFLQVFTGLIVSNPVAMETIKVLIALHILALVVLVFYQSIRLLYSNSDLQKDENAMTIAVNSVVVIAGCSLTLAVYRFALAY